MKRPTTRSVDLGSYRVDFVPHGDRIAHVIYAACEGKASPHGWAELLRSVEGSASEAWPDSPPLQELHIEDRGSAQVALLVGRAGKSHWSASIGCLQTTVDGGTLAETLIIDVACRVAATPAVLASTYELADGVEWLGQKMPSSVGAALDRRSSALISSPGSTWELTIDASSSLVPQASLRRFSVRPSPTAQTVPATIRWQIAVSSTRERGE